MRAPENVSTAFLVAGVDAAGNPAGQDDRIGLAIHRDALDKEFLLQASLIGRDPWPTWSGLKSRVVGFHKRAGKLFMLEATQGHTYYQEIPQHLILAEFAITEETDEYTFFDFNAGMASVFVMSDWYAHDYQSDAYPSYDSWLTVDVNTSYLDNAKFGDDNKLIVTQVAQLDLGSIRPTYQVTYYLTPYRPDPRFEPVISPEFERVGFFEVAPVIDGETGRTIVRASKFNNNKTITFAISSNTPQQYREAVRDGITYWNHALGAGAIEVVDAPAGITAPSDEYNVVQWIDWDEAGFAYADAQMDPRSGEILHAQVYMSSDFAVSGRASARQLLRRIEEDTSPASDKVISLSGLQKEPQCSLHFGRTAARTFATLLAEGVTDDEIARLSQDHVREVVAHEVGHTLGLRHNFAGSLATSYPLSLRKPLVEEYVNTGIVPAGAVPTSSVMDYLLFIDSAMAGRLISDGDRALEYDDKAIRVLYHGEQFDNEDLPFFCTDSHMGEFLDCRVFDTGASVVEFTRWDVEESLAIIPNLVIEQFISAKAPPLGYPTRPLEEVAIDPDFAGFYSLYYRPLLTMALQDETRLLPVWRSFPYVNVLNHDEVKAAQARYVADEFARYDGIEGLLAPPPEDYSARALEQFKSLIVTSAYRSGVGAGGQPYSFTLHDLAVMEEIADRIFSRAPEGLAKAEVATLGTADGLADKPLSEELAEFLADRAVMILTRTEGHETHEVEVRLAAEEGEVTVLTLALPTFSYSTAVRKAAGALLSSGRAVYPEWGLRPRERVRKTFETLLDEVLQYPIDTFELSAMPKPVARWILENRELLDSLP